MNARQRQAIRPALTRLFVQEFPAFSKTHRIGKLRSLPAQPEDLFTACNLCGGGNAEVLFEVVDGRGRPIWMAACADPANCSARIERGKMAPINTAGSINVGIIKAILNEEGINRRILPPRSDTPDDLWKKYL